MAAGDLGVPRLEAGGSRGGRALTSSPPFFPHSEICPAPPPQSHCTKQVHFQRGKQEALQRMGGGVAINPELGT